MKSEKGKDYLDQSTFPVQERKLCPLAITLLPGILLFLCSIHQCLHTHPFIPGSCLVLTSPTATPRAASLQALDSSCSASYRRVSASSVASTVMTTCPSPWHPSITPGSAILRCGAQPRACLPA